jgi:hypothetical protein
MLVKTDAPFTKDYILKAYYPASNNCSFIHPITLPLGFEICGNEKLTAEEADWIFDVKL